MKLRYASGSPFVRKVRVTAIECGLDDRIERIPTDVFDPANDLHTDNPLGKVPALLRDDGETLIDSPVICEYLDSLHDGPKLIPPAGEARWRTLDLQARADGIVDAGVLVRMEGMRPEPLRSADWTGAQRTKAARGLDWIEAHVDRLEGPLDIGQISVGCALGWIGFRLGRELWAGNRPGLVAWYDEFAKRPSMAATAPA